MSLPSITSTGYKSNLHPYFNTDLANIFILENNTSGTITGYLLENGDDLCTIFKQYTSGPQAPNTGFFYKVGSSYADLSTLFAPVVTPTPTPTPTPTQ